MNVLFIVSAPVLDEKGAGNDAGLFVLIPSPVNRTCLNSAVGLR